MAVQLSVIHWTYLLFVLIILGVMIAKRDTILPCLVGIFTLGLMARGGIVPAMQGVFNSMVYAGQYFMDIILVISVVVAMSKAMEEVGASALMIRPFRRLISTPTTAFWVSGVVMAIASFFFWPSPATPLVGAVLLPVAIRAGLPAIGFAVAINLFGHGLALSGDFIIQGAPKITAGAAGLSVDAVINASYPLVFIMGAVTIITAYVMLRRDMANGKIAAARVDGTASATADLETTPVARFAAIMVPVLFLVDVAIMFISRGWEQPLRGGDATALVGATAVLAMLIINIAQHKDRALEKTTQHLKTGFLFGMEIFGPVIPIGAFFFLGESDLAKSVLGQPISIFSDLGLALAAAIPLNKAMVAFAQTTVGGITGLDGSGFSGITLVGSLAKIFGTALKTSVATLTALGQIAAIWIGGGTVVPWGLIPAAAISGVNPMDLARRNFIPVMVGLLVTTVIGIFFL